ncbi:MAG TPA: phage tail terminator-like protein [Caulobacter sp.]|nr:phage tail terminator-like protein [Caulobacter sp.]
MSEAAMRAAVETALMTLGWEDQTAWENRAFNPTAGVPYQRVTCGFGRPNHQENRASYTQQGWMQVDLFYPSGDDPDAPPSGPGEATARAESLRTIFWRGRTLVHAGIKTTIWEAPEIMTGRRDGDRYIVPVVVRFYAQIEVQPA